MTSVDVVTRRQQQQYVAPATVMAATTRTIATMRHWTTFDTPTIFNHSTTISYAILSIEAVSKSSK